MENKEDVLSETAPIQTNATATAPDQIKSDEKNISYTNKTTLDLFSNPCYLNMLRKKKLREEKTNNNHKEDIKFYRKRITALFKDLLKGEQRECTDELKELQYSFVLTAINHFKMVDKKDIIQTQYDTNAIDADAIDTGANGIDADAIDTNGIENVMANINNYAMDDDDDDDNRALEGLTMDDIDITDATMEKADGYMMRKTIQVANLDNYVICNHDTYANDVRIIPFKMDIDLKLPEFKTKGVKAKKKKDLST